MQNRGKNIGESYFKINLTYFRLSFETANSKGCLKKLQWGLRSTPFCSRWHTVLYRLTLRAEMIGFSRMKRGPWLG